MTPVAEGHEPTSPARRLQRGAASRAGMAEDHARRRRATRSQNAGFPTTRQEEWRFTNVAPIAATAVHAGGRRRRRDRRADRARVAVAGAVRLVLRQRPLRAGAVGSHGACRPGVQVGSLAAAIAQDAHRVRQRTSASEPTDGLPFAALNTAFLEDGALMLVPQGRRHRDARSTSSSSPAAPARPWRTRACWWSAGAGSQSTPRRSASSRAAGDALLHQRGDRGHAGRPGAIVELLPRPARHRGLVPRHQPARQRVRATASLQVARRSRSAAASSRNDATRRARRRGRRTSTIDGSTWPTATQPRRQPHDHRSRHAALHQPRALQGHPRRQAPGRVQRPHHRPPGRAEDRRQADQPRAAAVGRGARSTRNRSSRSSPTTSSARTARRSGSSTRRRCSTCRRAA